MGIYVKLKLTRENRKGVHFYNKNINISLNPDNIYCYHSCYDQVPVCCFPHTSQELLLPKQYHKRIPCYSVCNKPVLAFNSKVFVGGCISLNSIRFVIKLCR